MKIVGILNVTADSFSDGGKYLDPATALSHAHRLIEDGADAIDIGAASSNPDAASVPPDVEIARLAGLVPTLLAENIPVSIDSFSVPVQRWALAQGIQILNDIHGFDDPALYPALAASETKLVVMHAVQRQGIATRMGVAPGEIVDRIIRFFDMRLSALMDAGIAQARLILDPGMGFFLGNDPQTSFAVLRALPQIKARFDLPVLISVSRKSFLRKVTGRSADRSGAASLAAELFACVQGADYIRTHDPAALRDGLTIHRALLGKVT